MLFENNDALLQKSIAFKKSFSLFFTVTKQCLLSIQSQVLNQQPLGYEPSALTASVDEHG